MASSRDQPCAPDEAKMRVVSVNQDPGIAPTRNKGAAIHLSAMRKAFGSLGCQVAAVDEPDGERLHRQLTQLLQDGSLDLIYERHALGRDISARFAARYRIPLVLEVNAPLAEEQSRYRGKPELSGDRDRDRIAFTTAALVVVVSSAVAEYAVQRGAAPDRVVICPNGIDEKLFNLSVRMRIKSLPGIPESSTVLGFHGRERPWHAFDDLVTVSASLLGSGRDLHFLVIGAGEFTGLSRLPRSAYTRLDWQPHEAMPELLSQVDILPMAHRADTDFYFSPLKLTEAMACGIVPVVPDVGDLATCVRHGETGLVYPAGELAALADGIDLLCSSADLRTTMGARAAAWAAGQTWTGIARRILAHPLLEPCREPGARVLDGCRP